MAVTAGSLLDFGFCTSGGDSGGASGRCAYNNDAASITAQYNYQNMRELQPGEWLKYTPLDGNLHIQ